MIPGRLNLQMWNCGYGGTAYKEALPTPGFSCQEATGRPGHGTMDWFQIGKGVRKGCILSPCLFNLYVECIM